MGTQVDTSWHLRVSLLPQCNFRCRYCNPKRIFEYSDVLSVEEILEIVRAAVKNGIQRVHWTGGEPCLKDVVSIFQRCRDMGIVEQVMTTNGSLRVDEIPEMAKAGLVRVNVSLDTLDSEKNRKITGCDFFESTNQWITAACEIFQKPTKVNIVPMRDNIVDVSDFVRFAEQFQGKLMLKFIELCPNNPAFYDTNIGNFHVPREAIIAELEKCGYLYATSATGDNPNAEYYKIGETGVVAILVTMPSQGYKCGLGKCRKMRVSPFGVVGSCIQQEGVCIKGASLEEKVRAIRNLIELREGYPDTPPVARHHFRSDFGFWRFGKVIKEG